MKLFDVIQKDLFSVLASPNRSLYADALDVLYDAFQDNLKIPESVYYSMLRNRLERQLAAASFEGEDIDEEELRDISGRARFLIRKLLSRGWFEKERGQDFEEYIIVPNYSIRLLELFRSLADDAPMRGFSYVYGTYSTLKVADDDDSVYNKMMAVYSAYDNMQALIKMLKTVYHNVNRFFQMQIDMDSVNRVLETHFDDFAQRVIEAYIRPLKVKDSVPKYRVPIQTILTKWLEDDALLAAMAEAAYQDKRKESKDSCRHDLMEKIFWIKERYESLEDDFLDEIDRQVRRYTRATTQKIENLTNRDQNTRGNLNYLLSALSRNRRAGTLLDRVQPLFVLYEQSYLSEKSLWYRKRPAKREKTAPVVVEESIPDEQALKEMDELAQNRFGKAVVRGYMEHVFGEEDVRYSCDLGVEDDRDYAMNLLAVLNSDDRDSFYRPEILEGDYAQGAYKVPSVRFTRKEKR